MKKLYVWDGDDVPGVSGIAFSLAESADDAREDITIGIVGSTLPLAVSEYDLDFLDFEPLVYSRAEVYPEAA